MDPTATTSRPALSLHPGEIEMPEAVVSETARQIDLACYMESLSAAAGAAGLRECPLTYVFNVGDGGDARDRMLIVTLEERVRDALMRSLEAVAKREALRSNPGQLSLGANAFTTFASVFRQMEQVPMTVLSITCPNPVSGRFLFAHFYVRTEFTVSELRKEMHWARFHRLPIVPLRDASLN